MEHKNPHATHVLEPKIQAESTGGETLEFIHKNINGGGAMCVCVPVYVRVSSVCVCGVLYFVVWRV